MKRLIFLALIAYTAWYGWNHRGDLRAGPHEEAVILNATGRPVTRIRLGAGGNVVVREALAPGESVTIDIPVQKTGEFTLTWQWGDAPGEPRWRGTILNESSEPRRYRFQLPPQGEVIWTTEPLPMGKSR